MHPGDATGQIEGARRQTIAVLNELISKAGGFELADPPPVLGQQLQKLRQNAYKVLVAGEAKRGKSTFVNALIGRDILPTDVDVATSQVFTVPPRAKPTGCASRTARRGRSHRRLSRSTARRRWRARCPSRRPTGSSAGS